MAKAATEELGRIGNFWLAGRHGTKSIYICWYDEKAKQRRSVSTGTSDLRKAQQALAEHVIKVHRPVDAAPVDVAISEALMWYWQEHASANEDSETAKRAGAVWLEFWGQDTVADIVFERVEAFKRWMHDEKGLAWSTVSRYLANGRAALNHAHARNRIASVPKVQDVPSELIKATAQAPYIMSLDEMATLFDSIKSDHIWNSALLMLGTLCRPEATLDFTMRQVAWEHGRIDMNPQGRVQTRKYRPVVRLPPFLRPWLNVFHREHGDALWVSYKGEAVGSMKTAARGLRKTMKLPANWTIKSIRHSMATTMASRGVNPWELSVQLGHARVEGAAKSTMCYAILSPTYLASIEPLIEQIVGEIDAKMKVRSLYHKPKLIAAKAVG
jgi:site-specific recombinase XerD